MQHDTKQKTHESLAKRIQSLLKSGSEKHSDLTVVCGNDTYHVHKAIVCSQSSWFETACKPGAFIEGVSNKITIPPCSDSSHDGDEPLLVEWMIQFLYGYDIFDAPFHTADDDEHHCDQCHYARTHYVRGHCTEGQLYLFARLYVIADKYQIGALQDHVLQLIRSRDVRLHGNDFVKALKYLERHNLGADCPLRLGIMEYAMAVPDYVFPMQSVREFLLESPGLALELLQQPWRDDHDETELE